LQHADRLVVLDRGSIVEIGTHDTLMEREGHYHRLYQAQARNVDTEEDLRRPSMEPKSRTAE
jgi:ATP-binding cassette subfamily B protein